MRGFRFYCLGVVAMLAVTFLGGCGGDKPDLNIAESQQTPSTVAEREEPTPDVAYYSAPDFLGYAPYTVNLRLPREVPGFGDEEYCRWDLDDGTSVVAASVRKTYEIAGTYQPEWSVHGPDGLLRSGTYGVQVLPHVSIRLDRRSNDFPALPGGAVRVRFPDAPIPEGEVLIAGPKGFSFVNATAGHVRLFLPYDDRMPMKIGESPLHVLTEEFLYVDGGDATMLVYKRSTGELQREICVWDQLGQEARIWALAADHSSSDVYAIVYPDTYSPEEGFTYCWNEKESDLRRLSESAPARGCHPVGDQYRLLYEPESESLLLLMQLTSAVCTSDTPKQDESKRLLVLGSDDGAELGRLELPVERDVVGDLAYDSELGVIYFATGRELVVVAARSPFEDSQFLTVPIDDVVTGFCFDSRSGEVYLSTFHGNQDDAMLHRLNLSNQTAESIDISGPLPHRRGFEDTHIAFAYTDTGMVTTVSEGHECAILRPVSFQLEKKLTLERTILIGGHDSTNGRLLLVDREGAIIQFMSLDQGIESAELGRPIQIPSDCSAVQALWEDRMGMIVLSCSDRIVLWDPDTNRIAASLELTGMPFDKSYYSNWLISGQWSDMTLLQVLSAGESKSPMYRIDWMEPAIEAWQDLPLPDGADWSRSGESELYVDRSGSLGFITSIGSFDSFVCVIDWAALEPKIVYELDEAVFSLCTDAEQQLWLLTDESLLVIKDPADLRAQHTRVVYELPENLEGYPVGAHPVQRLCVCDGIAAMVEPDTGNVLLARTDTLIGSMSDSPRN